jgi:hypothetical protein
LVTGTRAWAVANLQFRRFRQPTNGDGTENEFSAGREGGARRGDEKGEIRRAATEEGGNGGV